jgi:hypothetical protein
VSQIDDPIFEAAEKRFGRSAVRARVEELLERLVRIAHSPTLSTKRSATSCPRAQQWVLDRLVIGLRQPGAFPCIANGVSAPRLRSGGAGTCGITGPPLRIQLLSG